MAGVKVFKGIGIVSAQRLGIANAPMRDLGDVEQFKIAHRTSSITWKQHRRVGGGNLAKLDNPEGVDLTVQMQEWTEENQAMVTQGKVVELEPETVTGEEVVLIPGSLVVTDFPGPTSLVITKTLGSTPVPTTEVELSAAGFRVKADSTAITEPTPATIAYALLDEIGLRELQMMTDLEKEFVDDLAPSQLRQVYEACRDMNPDFFALRGRLEERGRAILARLSGSLNETQAP